MARASRVRDIDGFTFGVTQLPAMRSVKLMHKLTQALGPGLLKALAGVTDTEEVSLSKVWNGDVRGLGKLAPAVGDGLQMLFDRFSADDLEALIRELFETATVKVGTDTIPLMPVFDEIMAGHTATIFKAVKFAVEVNYHDFLGALLAGAKTMQARESLSKASITSPGPASV